MNKSLMIITTISVLVAFLGYSILEWTKPFSVTYEANVSEAVKDLLPKPTTTSYPPLDKALYDKKMEALANNPIVATTSSSTVSTTPSKWPVKGPYPLDGALLPFNRIIAYYGNFYSTKMGVLGEYEPKTMLSMLMAEKVKWEAADPETPVIPAIHYIAITAQGSPGQDGMYRLRMPKDQIEKALQLGDQIDGIVFLDIQIGLSTLQKEVPLLEEYLKKPNVHFGIDPEFSMKTGAKPGTVIGTFDAADINYVIDYLAKIVQENNLPPKVLVIHRFTQKMITNYQDIKRVPEVQVVIDMDGWGPPAQKINTYKSFIVPEPVQFTGFKLFYKNDLKLPGGRVMTPQELLQLRPKPIYIQYQ